MKDLGFIFSGQGAQWFAMGRSLLTSSGEFRNVIEEVGAELSRLGWLVEEKGTLHGELNRDKPTSRMRETHVGQPCLFALQVGTPCVSRVLPRIAAMPHGNGHADEKECRAME